MITNIRFFNHKPHNWMKKIYNGNNKVVIGFEKNERLKNEN